MKHLKREWNSSQEQAHFRFFLPLSAQTLKITWGTEGFPEAHEVIMPEKREDYQCLNKARVSYFVRNNPLRRLISVTVPGHQRLILPSCQEGERWVENLQSPFSDSDSAEEAAAVEEEAAAVRCSS